MLVALYAKKGMSLMALKKCHELTLHKTSFFSTENEDPGNNWNCFEDCWRSWRAHLTAEEQ